MQPPGEHTSIYYYGGLPPIFDTTTLSKMGNLFSHLGEILAKSIASSYRENEKRWRETIDSAEEDWHPDYIRSQIIDAEEVLHLKRLWQRLTFLWSILGNLLIAAALLLGSIRHIALISDYHTQLLAILAASLIISPTASYRQYKRTRRIRIILKKLSILHRRIRSHDFEIAASSNDVIETALIEQKRYREELPEVIQQYRDEANRYRKVHNRLQSVIIVGSVLTSAITTASVSYEQVRWFAVAISAIVGLAAGFTGYFKYRERSFNLQQTADAIEREYESVELRVGRYANQGEAIAYMTFANTVENLRDEQNKRQQQLDQPVEVRREQ